MAFVLSQILFLVWTASGELTIIYHNVYYKRDGVDGSTRYNLFYTCLMLFHYVTVLLETTI